MLSKQPILFLVSWLLFGITSGALSAESADKTEIRAVILNFAEGCYAGDTERVASAFHRDLDKGGFGRLHDGTYVHGKFTYAQIIEACRTLYTERMALPANPRLEIIIYEVLDQTASAKLEAAWGIDFVHLAKYDGAWKIKNSMGQSYPPE